MGDETSQFASRFSSAVSRLAALAEDDVYAELLKTDRPKLASHVRDALDAIQAVYGTGTNAVRNWPEQRRRVLAQLARMREALERSSEDGELRRMASALVGIIERR